MAVALTDLTRKGAPNKLSWEAPQELVFVTLRNNVANAPILRLPDYTKQFMLHRGGQ